jgi:hypothetical protein
MGILKDGCRKKNEDGGLKYLLQLKRIVIVKTIKRKPLLLKDAGQSPAALQLNQPGTTSKRKIGYLA